MEADAMTMFSAASDRDYDDECHGPYGRGARRTCSQCGRSFWMSTAEEYVLHVVCDRCASIALTLQRVRQIEQQIFAKR